MQKASGDPTEGLPDTSNSRRVDTVMLTVRHRAYDFDNRTPVFHVITLHVPLVEKEARTGG
jgi:hypothetical protein